MKFIDTAHENYFQRAIGRSWLFWLYLALCLAVSVPAIVTSIRVWGRFPVPVSLGLVCIASTLLAVVYNLFRQHRRVQRIIGVGATGESLHTVNSELLREFAQAYFTLMTIALVAGGFLFSLLARLVGVR